MPHPELLKMKGPGNKARGAWDKVCRGKSGRMDLRRAHVEEVGTVPSSGSQFKFWVSAILTFKCQVRWPYSQEALASCVTHRCWFPAPLPVWTGWVACSGSLRRSTAYRKMSPQQYSQPWLPRVSMGLKGLQLVLRWDTESSGCGCLLFEIPTS